MNKTNKNYLQAILYHHACYCCIHHLHTMSKYLMIVILCKYSKCNPILLKEGSLKCMKVTNETQHYCIGIFRFELVYKNNLRTHED